MKCIGRMALCLAMLLMVFGLSVSPSASAQVSKPNIILILSDDFGYGDASITKVDKGTKTVVVKSADGTEKTFEYTANASKDIGEATGKGVEKGTKVTVYYTEEAGKKVAHFFASW